MTIAGTRKFVDLSLSIEESESEVIPVQLRYFTHREGAEQMGQIFGVNADTLPGKLGWAGEEVRMITHAGTHMDAPWHYGPVSQERPARTIDEVPLEWCYGPGVVLDFRNMQEGTEIVIDDLKSALARIDYQLHERDIVLLHTGADQWWGDKSYPERGVGLGHDATLWLLDQGIRVIGTDSWGLDRPFSYMRNEFQKTGNVNCIWPSHYAGRSKEYCQIEKLTHLELLPARGFTVMCFPIKVTKASAGWTRVVAMFPD
ncbi:MAG TPA: cyclase family protein [Verrucomicrobiae bacterium]|jgi:kynurenine formamidase|nr:cyclase family protein [Verrucomicrobiae bacterium]